MLSEQIKRVALVNPTVQCCIALYSSGQCTWQEAMQLALVAVADQNANLMDLLGKVDLYRPIILNTK